MPERIAWRSLSYRANSVLAKVTTEVRLAVLPTREAADELIAVPQADVLQPSNETIIFITVDSNINPIFGSNETLKIRSWSNPNDAAVLQCIKLRQGNKIWQKSYRFLPTGVYHLRKKPADNKQLELLPDQWTTFEKRFYRYNDKNLNCSAVIEPSGLLYLILGIDLRALKDPLSFCVLDKQQLHRVTVTGEGARQLKVNYLERSPGKQIRREGTVDVVKISFRPHFAALKGEESEDFSFQGLKGDFDIFLDKTSRIPIQVSGKVATFGKVDILLREVEISPGDR